jgi:hypothetical protein
VLLEHWVPQELRVLKGVEDLKELLEFQVP